MMPRPTILPSDSPELLFFNESYMISINIDTGGETSIGDLSSNSTDFDFSYYVTTEGGELGEEVPDFQISYLIRIVTLSIIFILSVPLNFLVLWTVWRQRRRKSRVNLLVLHLTIADLLITFINIPTDVVWFHTVAWLAGNAMCKVIMFLETFAMYASSFVLIVISIDRYAAIVHPLSVRAADRRCKLMLPIAWGSAAACSIPQVRHYPLPLYMLYKFYCYHGNNMSSYNCISILILQLSTALNLIKLYHSIIIKSCHNSCVYILFRKWYSIKTRNLNLNWMLLMKTTL